MLISETHNGMRCIEWIFHKLIDASLKDGRIWNISLSAAEIVSFDDIWATCGIYTTHDYLQMLNRNKSHLYRGDSRQSLGSI